MRVGLKEGKMADFVVCRLVQRLDRLIPILQKILNLKKLQAKLFTEKVGEVIMLLNVKGAPNLPDQLVEEILPLALPVGDFVRTELGYEMTTCFEWGRKLSSEVPELVEEIGLNEKKLEKFLDSTDFYNDWERLRNNLVLLPCREPVRALLRASRLLKDTINFFHEFSTELAALRECLRFLLAFTKQCEHPKEWHCHQFVQGIRFVTIRARDADDWHYIRTLEWMMGKLENDPRGIRYPAEVAKQNCIETRTKEYFDGKISMRLFLLDTLRMWYPAEGAYQNCIETMGKKKFDWKFQRLLFWLGNSSLWFPAEVADQNCVETTAKIYSDWKNPRRLVLLDTLGMLHSFKEEIDMNLGKLGREDLQSQNAAFGGNDFTSPSMICERFAREDLPSLPVRYHQWADWIKRKIDALLNHIAEHHHKM